MSITSGLLSFGLRYVFSESVENVLDTIENRLTDHSKALPKALSKANDRAWEAVGLALAGDSWLGRIKDIFIDGDIKGIRDQIMGFLRQTPTGLESRSAHVRAKATEEWLDLRKAKKLSAELHSHTDIAIRAASMERIGDQVQIIAAAHRAVEDTAFTLQTEAPFLADLLIAAPPGGTPLLVAAFAFFFRREIETNPELANGLSFDFLRQICKQQEQGFALLDARTSGINDQLGRLFDAIEESIAGVHAKLSELGAKLDRLIEQRDIPTSISEPLRVSVTSKKELDFLQMVREQFRNLPPEHIESADWTRLGDVLAAAGEPKQADESHAASAEAANAVGDREREAEAEFKRFRASCEMGDRDAAITYLQRALAIQPDRYALFDLHRYTPTAVLGVGGFGTVFLAEDQYRFVEVGEGMKPQKVAIKSIHDSKLDEILERDLYETFNEAETLTSLNHPGIIKALDRGFGDPVRRKRPFLVLEYFPGVTLESWLGSNEPLPVKDVLVIARKIAEAVHAAHNIGTFHRDIKPANVMVDFDKEKQDWKVKVIDFGLAVRLHTARTSLSISSGRRTALDRNLAGTLHYAPPEQRNELDVDVGPYSDVYAWGKTCLFLLFKTTEPKSIHWRNLPAGYRDSLQEILERATIDELENPEQNLRRFPNFEPVLTKLAALLGDSPNLIASTDLLEDPAAKGKDVYKKPSAPFLNESLSFLGSTITPKPTTITDSPDILLAGTIEGSSADTALRPDEVLLVLNDHFIISSNLNPWLTKEICRSSVVNVECVAMPGNPIFMFVPFEKGPCYGMKLAGDADHGSWQRVTANASNKNRITLRVKFRVSPVQIGPETKIQLFKRVKKEISELGREAQALAGPAGGFDYNAAVQKLSNLTSEQGEIWAGNQLPEKELLRDLTAKRDNLNELREKIDPIYQRHSFHDPRLRLWVEQYLSVQPDDREMRELLDELPPPKEPPANPRVGDIFTIQMPMDAEMKFAWIPGPGTFLMGGNGRDENPQCQVTINKGFWMGITPVTQIQWRAAVCPNPSGFQGDNLPVENVSWLDCQEFCQQFSLFTRKPIRLPTEAEWEYACRAGSTTDYWIGNGVEALKKIGWFDANSQRQTKPVGKLLANPWGLYDVHGNVWEWCQDRHMELAAQTLIGLNDQSIEESRVIRGGSWFNSPTNCLAAYRGRFAPEKSNKLVGLRVCFCLDD